MARDETGKRHGRGGNVGRMARDERGKRHGRGGNVGRMARDETGKRHGRGGNVGRMARDERGKRHGRGGNVGRMARDETRKLARAGAETSGGWRATKRENWHGRVRKRRADGARRNGKTGTGGAETTSEEAGRSMLTDHSNNSTKQASRNSRINLSHTLERRRRATARYTSTNHYGALTTASKH